MHLESSLEQIGMAHAAVAAGLECGLKRNGFGHGSQWVAGVALNRMKYDTDLGACQARVRSGSVGLLRRRLQQGGLRGAAVEAELGIVV